VSLTAYEGRNGIIFGANSFFGREMIEFLSRRHVHLGLIDLDGYADASIAGIGKKYGTTSIYRMVTVASENAFRSAVEEIGNTLGDIDYLICSYYLEDLRAKIDAEDLSPETWDTVFEEWLVSYFLVMKAAVPRMCGETGGKVVFVTSTAGYTGEGEGEGELTDGGSMHESACSSGITGMMTSIARDSIPRGIAVNGIALGPDYENDRERIVWATHLWLSGMGDYSCAQILRLY